MEFLNLLKHWIVQVFIIVFISLLIDLIQKRILTRLHRKLETTNSLWYDAVLDALRRPLSLFIWVIGLFFAVEIIVHETGTGFYFPIASLRYLGIIAAFTWFLQRFIGKAQESILATYAKKGKPVDKTTAEAIAKVLRIAILITSGLVMLQTLGFSITGIFAFAGAGGITLGFAAKDLLANFFGGLMLYWDRPFKVGDWICSPDKEIEGTVEAIGWRLTRIRTFEKRPLYVPNSTFTTITVENPSRMTHRRIYETIGVRYDDAKCMSAILQDVREMLLKHPEIDQKQTLMVNLNTFGSSSLDFFIYTFTRTTVWTKYHHVKEDVLLKIYAIVKSHGAEVAFPTSTVHLAHEKSIDPRSFKIPEPKSLPAQQ